MPSATTDPATAGLDRRLVAREVENGLPDARKRLARAIENQAFYDLDGLRYMPRRESENEFDFVGRPKRESGFTQEVIDVLCEHQYQPGPARTVDGDPDAEALLAEVYECNHIDALMQRAEVLSTLNDVAAIEVKATNDDDCPIDLQLWGSEEFHVFPDPNKPQRPACVVTIDRQDGRTRYREWWPDVVNTYLTARYDSDRTAGARMADRVASEPNTYGCLPFAFVHAKMPVREFWTPGVGSHVRRAEMRINDRLSKLDEAIEKYSTPIGLFRNVSPEFNPVIQPGRWIRLISAALSPLGGDFGGNQAEPTAEYLQAVLDIAGQWEDIRQFVSLVLESLRVPLSAVRMEQQGVASGIALLVEQAPLLTRAKARRGAFVVYETRLAKLILACHGSHYDRPEPAACAATLRLLLSWPEAEVPIPGPERDASDEWELSQGILSRVELIKRRRGFATTQQALAYLKQVKKENDQADKIDPPAPPPVATAEPGEKVAPAPVDPEKGDGNG